MFLPDRLELVQYSEMIAIFRCDELWTTSAKRISAGSVRGERDNTAFVAIGASEFRFYCLQFSCRLFIGNLVVLNDFSILDTAYGHTDCPRINGA